nr:hypothetical protein [Tanacetum cinerariifolium]
MAMMMKRIGELEHIMANLIQKNKGLEERLDKHGAHLYTLEQLDIPHQVSKAVKLAQDLAEARKKKKKSRESPKTPSRSPPHQPPPPPPPVGPSEASGAPGAYGSSQVPPSPPSPSSTNPENLEMDEDMGLDEQAQSSDDEDIRSAHIPKTRYLHRPMISPYLWTGSARDEALLSLNLKTWKALLLKSSKSFILM